MKIMVSENMNNEKGKLMYSWLKDLFPICRSITGDGVRETLGYIKNLLPELSIYEVPSGTRVFDWIIPDEWNIKDAFVADQSGKRLIDFQQNNLHVLGYSEPVDREMSFEELDKNLHSLPNQPTAIPYITSYYKRQWGFCLSESQRDELRKNPKAKYHVKIDSTLDPGHLTYGELIIPGQTTEEILLSTYVCHPSLANNELSGPVVAMALSQYVMNLPERKYTYRILFLPETIGSITYLSQHHEVMKKNTVAGFVLSCLGDERNYSHIASRLGNTLADRVAKYVLQHHDPNYKAYTFLSRGSDERQYCSPGIDLPVCGICRTRYGDFPEYHTSLDNLSLVTAEGLQGSLEVLQKCIYTLENNRVFRCKIKGEPHLARRALYPSLSTKEWNENVRLMRMMMNLVAYADGQHSLLDIAEIIGADMNELTPMVEKLLNLDLLEELNADMPNPHSFEELRSETQM